MLVFGIAIMLASCSKADVKETVSGRTFKWEKEGFGGDFTITLEKDGKFNYYEGYLSSYLGYGDWSVEDDTVILKENDREFHFRVKDGELIFLSDESNKFIYTSVENGDRFIMTDQK